MKKQELHNMVADIIKELRSEKPQQSPNPNEEPDTITMPDPDEETVKTPQRPPSIDPFKRRPHIQPGEEPGPKAKHKQIETEAIEYDDPNVKMNPDLEKKLATGKHLYGKFKNYPAEKLAGNRFNELVGKLRHYLGNQDYSDFDIKSLYELLIDSLNQIIKIESAHKTELEKLAIRLVEFLYHIPKNSLKYDVKIVLSNEINASGIKKQAEKKSKKEIQIAVTDINANIIDAESQKRRLINAMMHGAAAKGQYAFNIVNDQLNKINPKLLNLYGLMISANELNYWLWDDDMIAAAGGAEKMAAKEKIDMSTDPPTVYVRAINFTTLVHELVKAVMEYLSLYGLPTDDNIRRAVLKKTDLLDSEMWDLRFGPGTWDSFLNSIDASEEEIKHMLYVELIQMPATEFNQFITDMVNDVPTAKKKMKELATDIRQKLKDENYRSAMGESFRISKLKNMINEEIRKILK